MRSLEGCARVIFWIQPARSRSRGPLSSSSSGGLRPSSPPRSRARRRSTRVVVSRSPCDGSTLGLLLAGVFVVSLPGRVWLPFLRLRFRGGARPGREPAPGLGNLPASVLFPSPLLSETPRRTHPDDRKTPPLISDGYLWPRTLATNAEGFVPSAAKSAAKSDESKQAQGIDRVPSRARAR